VPFDPVPVLFATNCLFALVAAQMIYFWLQNRHAIWLLWWAAPFLIAIAALGAYHTGPVAGTAMDLAWPQAVLLTCFWCVWQGARLFERRRIMVWPILLVAGAWVLACQIPEFAQSVPLRVSTSSVARAAFLGLTAFEFWRGRAERLPSRRMAIIIASSLAAFSVFRVFAAFFLPFPLGGLEPTQAAFIIQTGIVIAHGATLTLLIVSLSKEREERTQRQFAAHDPLTSLRNRRAFEEDAPAIARRQARRNAPLSVLMFDLDHFKKINDRYGHRAGDMALIAFGAIAEARLGAQHSLYRLGGEEFCALLPGTTDRGARKIANRIRREFADSFETFDFVPPLPSVSVGIATSIAGEVSLETLLQRADRALYVAKARGRNRVILARDQLGLRLRAPATGPEGVRARPA
jgi:diguanylate cyclase (GGDEF)-like protein